MSLRAFVNSATDGRPCPQPALSAFLLTRYRPRYQLPYVPPLPSPSIDLSLSAAFALPHSDGAYATTLDFLHHRTGALLFSIPNLPPVVTHDYHPPSATLSLSTRLPDSHVAYLRYLTVDAIHRTTPLPRIRATAHHAAGLLAVGLHGEALLYSALPHDTNLHLEARLPAACHAAVVAADFLAPHLLVTGNSAGQVVLQDARAPPSAPALSFAPAHPPCPVSALRCSQVASAVYVACHLANPSAALTKWDLRALRDPVASFRRPACWAHSIAFDVADAAPGALLAAGGSDGHVTLWDPHRGGAPLAQVPLDRHPTRLTMVGWHHHVPGLVVETEVEMYFFSMRRQ